MAQREAIQGVGLGLRWEFLDDVLEHLGGAGAGGESGSVHAALDDVPFFEVSPENYMRRGGYYPAALERVAARYPLLAHGLTMSLGSVDPFDDAYMRALADFVRRADPPFYSDHLCFCGVDARTLHDLLPIPFTRAGAAHVAARVREAASRLERPMAIENITHYLVPGEPTIDETGFIASILEQSGAGLLLDVNNVHVNAQNYGFDPLAWLRAIPLERVVQIHIAGHELSEEEGVLLDTHGAPVVPPVYELLEWVIARTGPLPVLLERDNKVPPLAELLSERAAIAVAYERGLALHAERLTVPDHGPPEVGVADVSLPDAPGARVGPPDDLARVTRILHAVQHTIRDAGVDAEPLGWLASAGLAASDADALAKLGPKRILLYRRLVRRGLTRAIRVEIPRTAARLGPAFERYVDRFFAEELPRSHYLRDVAFELVGWAAPLLREDPAVPGYLVDLAWHELSSFQIAMAQGSLADRGAPAPLELDRPVVFTPAMRVARYEHAIHLLEDGEGASAPPARPTALLVYRDAEHDVRHLELSPLAAAILDRLVTGETLRSGLVGACEALGHPLDAAVLEGASTLLADLSERGVLHGAG